ncbi:hypothetical protein [Nitratireductor sp. GCM10026969]|uniref:hypothetical protein n=1 Tax=Nitratireductor sp. GCM10026969 TaxID=3252645 RepID=UPI0036223E87
MEAITPDPNTFFHVRVFIGIITGLSVARVLNGLAFLVQHPRREHVYSVHIGWALFLLLAVMHFWWFEIGLAKIERWTFELYFFVIFYAALFFFTCAVLFPDKMSEYPNYRDYFHTRQKWFYGLLASLFIVDLADTAFKGLEHFRSLGLFYPMRQIGLSVLALIAMWIRNYRYHVAFVVVALIAEIVWILNQFEVLN